MSLFKIKLKKDALRDIEESRAYLEAQKENLGKEFVGEFYETSKKIAQNPKGFLIFLGDVRRALMKRFKFGVYFSLNEEEQEVHVLNVVHQNRNPKTILKKLGVKK